MDLFIESGIIIMSEIASAPSPSRKRPSNEMTPNFPHAPSAAAAQQHAESLLAPTVQDTNQNNNNDADKNIVLLSLREEYYRKIMWAQYNSLGRTRNTDREELVSQQLFERFQKENGGEGVCRFYKVERGGKRILVEEQEALDSECSGCVIEIVD